MLITTVIAAMSIVEYAAPVWHHLLTNCQSDQIEAIQKRAINIIQFNYCAFIIVSFFLFYHAVATAANKDVYNSQSYSWHAIL